MTRIKKEFQKKGFMLENDFEYLPMDGIQGVGINCEECVYSVYHISITIKYKMFRDGSIKEISYC